MTDAEVWDVCWIVAYTGILCLALVWLDRFWRGQ